MEAFSNQPADSVIKEESALPGVNVLLMGPTGTGKTHSLGTFVDATQHEGFDSFYLGLEPGLESLLGYWKDRGKPIPRNLHWHTLKRAETSFLTMVSDAEKINTFNLESLSKMNDPNRGKHNQFVELLKALNNFPSDRAEDQGAKFGDVASWGTNRALFMDGLTGLGICAMALVVGGKPVKSQSDWGIAQDQIEKLLRMICEGCKCHFVLLAHVEMETDLILGGRKIMVQTLGKALPPKLPPMFSDAILTVREGAKWTWDTSSSMADLKTRNLPIAAGLPPDLGVILKKWQSRGGKL